MDLMHTTRSLVVLQRTKRRATRLPGTFGKQDHILGGRVQDLDSPDSIIEDGMALPICTVDRVLIDDTWFGTRIGKVEQLSDDLLLAERRLLTLRPVTFLADDDHPHLLTNQHIKQTSVHGGKASYTPRCAGWNPTG